MSIISSAKALAKSKRKADLQAEKEAKEASRENDKTIEAVRKSIMSLLKKEVQGKHGFIVSKAEWSPFGSLASIDRKGKKGFSDEYIGTVCVTRQNYTFRGSDESPEQECSALVVTLSRIVNAGDCKIIVSPDDGLYGLDKIVNNVTRKFKKMLAIVLSSYF